VTSSQDRIHELATLIADGTPIDWQALEATSEGDDPAILRSLRLVAKVSSLQGLPDDKATFGHLELLEKVGQGSYGTVYKAWDPRLDRVVALKVLEPRARAGRPETLRPGDPRVLLAEGRRLASVKHSNVVTVFSADVIEERCAIAMEFIEGCTLADLARLQGTFGPDEIIGAGVQLCRALAAVHAAGLVHQDVKATNVMREHGGRIVLMDFGPGGTTPLYSAPELLRGEVPSVATDLYSLGVLLYHLATGTYPIVAASLPELRRHHEASPAKHVRDLRPSLPHALNAVIERAISADPAARYGSAGEMEAALEHVRSELRTRDAHDVSPSSRATQGPRANRRTLGTVFAALAAAAALAVLLTGFHPAKRGPTAGEPAGTAAIIPAGIGAEPLSVDAAFHRGALTRTPLADGDPIAVGDSVSLVVTSSVPVHVYVIDEDDHGEAYLLFPTTQLAPRNPLEPNVTHHLPGSREGRRFYWQVTSAGGREHLFVIASPTRLVELEAELLSLDRPSETREPVYPALTAAAKATLRGIGGLVSDSPAHGGPGELPLAVMLAHAPVLSGSGDESRGVWIRRLDLIHAPH